MRISVVSALTLLAATSLTFAAPTTFGDLVNRSERQTGVVKGPERRNIIGVDGDLVQRSERQTGVVKPRNEPPADRETGTVKWKRQNSDRQTGTVKWKRQDDDESDRQTGTVKW
ncbi:hypothetical protein CC2G_006579 [Coprinopsis cinerea AmutBmut pab1-1]|nr:hypothetical protein CC2G_006579 [Coprinopsis cinerea AmutBmut pab1-1]